jgi:LmbE family N-acetylglucosaminyl deacetylase
MNSATILGPDRSALVAPLAHRDAADVAALGTILGVWAHPDDEAYLSAGLMALARDNGQRVVVVTATAGELGTSDPETWPPDRLADLRRGELAASLGMLGVHEHHWLGYADGACERALQMEAVNAIGRIIDTVAPDTIVTFGPEGMTGHPDHRAVSAWTSMAWRLRRPQATLLHATLLPSFHADWHELNERIGLFGDHPAPYTAPERAALVIECDPDLLDRKVGALGAHASQTAPLVEQLGADTYRRWWSTEAFVAVGHPRGLR